VLGYDDEVSRDHDWGPRLELFLNPADRQAQTPRLLEVFAEDLPRTFHGYPTSFVLAADGVGVLAEAERDTPIRHRVELCEVAEWCDFMLGFDPRRGVSWLDWLATSSHRLAEITGGVVFHDGLWELVRLREALGYYPREVWLFVLASQWRRIGQEEALVGRSSQVGDDLGSTVLAARLVRDLMRLCLIMERRYIPYAKWLGTAFAHLEIAGPLTPHLEAALHTKDPTLRQRELAVAYETVAERHNALGITNPVEPHVRPFWTRGFPVILADRFATVIRAELAETELHDLPMIGSADQFLDSTDVLAPAHRARAAALSLLQHHGA
jgi:hypothetical protein